MTQMLNSQSIKYKVIVGMSGGVDSSVAAFLLQKQGYHIEGLFMKNWEEDDTDEHCSAKEDIADAQAVCDRLGIKLHRVNFAAEYWDAVFENFLSEYRAGRTPNPDILCNREIKFKAFLDYATEHLGADAIATGHYACIQSSDSAYQLIRGIDHNKDQTYFLYTLNQHQLSRSLFPIGEYEKPHVRKIAEQAGFITHNKKDSTGICFIGEKKFTTFLSTYLPAQPGNIETIDGEIIGKHQGLMYHTIGQRKGLMIGGLKNHDESPWYVVKKDLERNTLLVAQGHDHPLLYSTHCIINQCSWINGHPPGKLFTATAKTRYRQQDKSCTATQLNDTQWQVEFDQPEFAITLGQSIVFYQNTVCLGGGIIEKSLQTGSSN